MTRKLARSGSVEVAYTAEGSGPETVLLIMGLAGRAADWGTLFPSALAERYRVVRMDNRGIGGSPRVDGGYTLSDMAADAIAVLDDTGAARAHIVGYSMGGMISQLIATEHAERVDRLVLLSTHFGGRDTDPPTASAQRLFDPQEFISRGKDAEVLMRFTLEMLTARGFADRAPEALAMMVANVRAEPTRTAAFMSQVQAILASDRSELVRTIQKPTLVIHGKEDELIPVSNGRELAHRIPGARLSILEGTGHMPMLECPDKLADLVLEFFAG
jgi:3-oxoadipate enol-lactonase